MAETPLILGNNIAIRATITGQVNPDTRYSLDRLVDLKRYTQWRSTDTVLKNLDFAIPAAYQRAVNCLIIDRNHTLDGVACRFLYSDDGSPETFTQIDSFTPSGSGVIFRRFSGQTAHPTYRLELGASSELHRIPQIWFGEAWTMLAGPVNGFAPRRRLVQYDDFDSDSGVLVRMNKFKKEVRDMRLILRTAAERTKFYQLLDDFEEYGGFCWYVTKPDTDPTQIIYAVHKNTEFADESQHEDVAPTVSLRLEEVLGS